MKNVLKLGFCSNIRAGISIGKKLQLSQWFDSSRVLLAILASLKMTDTKDLVVLNDQ